LAKRQSVTSIGANPEAERRSRFIKYTIAMIVRVICILLAVVVPLGWLTLVFAIGAIFLPYFAVVLANVGESQTEDRSPKIQAPTLSISASDFKLPEESDDK
jgi:predicted tellurium resistance membrane protein TerC